VRAASIRVRVRTSDLESYCAALNQKGYKYSRPGLQDMEWGDREMCISDPFDNRLIFFMKKTP
jgi:hypothetical protein